MNSSPTRVSTLDQTHVGILYGVASFLAWGFMPLYWKLLSKVPAVELLSHRVVWASIFVVTLLTQRRRLRELTAVLRSPRIVASLMASALLIGTNWGLYIWAVNTGHVLQASLGYYINPLLNVLLGSLFLRESLSKIQKISIVIAAVGVSIMASGSSDFPWVALALALTFGLYSLIRKTVAIDSLLGLALESLMLFPLALFYLLWTDRTVESAFFRHGLAADIMLVLSGPITALPLLWFAHAARRLRLSTLGLLQYMAPTCQFLLAIFAFGEDFTAKEGAAFAAIWIAIGIYAWASRRQSLAVKAVAKVSS